MKRVSPGILCIVLAALLSCSYGIISEREPLQEDMYLCEGLFKTRYSFEELKQRVDRLRALLESNLRYPTLDIFSPFDGALFPRDMASPSFSWGNRNPGVKTWIVRIRFEESSHALYVLTDTPAWTPGKDAWELIKKQSLEREAFITIAAFSGNEHSEILAVGHITISTSRDEVASPVLYQHMPLPFAAAKRNPKQSVWRLGSVSSYEEPPVVMKDLPVCGNCHCVSQDGTMFGMDMDINNDKGAYAVRNIEENMVLDRDDFITWNDFQRADNVQSMGLFSRISPDNKFILSTVGETSFFCMIPDINFSQFFFPIRGLIGCYSVAEDRFFALPGADDPDYVQTCAEWSPDGKHVVFARAATDERLVKIIGDKGYFDLEPGERIMDLNRKYQIHFDLYRVAFNNGNGGAPEPLAGASNNGMSNYFPRYSPDGKWIVFTQSPNGLAIQPQSKLVIIPAEGGDARVLRCNMEIMNSWHSWSPNSRWLVFSSKSNTPFTELFLTHIDEHGYDSPPVLLSRFSSPSRACLAPELVNLRPESIRTIAIAGDPSSWAELSGPKSSDNNAR